MARDNSQGTRRKQEALAMFEERIREQERAIQSLSREVEEAGRAGASGERKALDRLHA